MERTAAFQELPLNRCLLDKLQPRINDVNESLAVRGFLKNDPGTRLACTDGESKRRPFPTGRSGSDRLTGQARSSVPFDAQARRRAFRNAEHRHQFVGRSRLQPRDRLAQTALPRP